MFKLRPSRNSQRYADAGRDTVSAWAGWPGVTVTVTGLIGLQPGVIAVWRPVGPQLFKHVRPYDTCSCC